ncbi:MAG: MlaD family protein [Cyclobacteriaceae bacterium]|nr:MlaD family protein [Cyclobacteriaceae bacterium]
MSKEFRIGLIALVSGLILYYGFNYLKGIDFFTKTSKYYVIYDNVDGLNKSNPVIINGLTVGKVSNIRLLQAEQNKILVEITIDREIVLGKATIAELSNTDFLGSKAIILKIGVVKQPIFPLDTLNPYVNKGIEEYLSNVEPITNDLGVTISRVNEILLGLQGSGEKINSTIGDLKIMVNQVNGLIKTNREELDETLSASRELIQNINQKVNMLGPILVKSNGVLDSLNTLELNNTVTSLNAMLNQVTELLKEVDNGEGTLGKLANNDSLYNNLNQLLVDLDKLSIHFNQYPRDFLKPLGRKNEKLKGVEKSGE